MTATCPPINPRELPYWRPAWRLVLGLWLAGFGCAGGVLAQTGELRTIAEVRGLTAEQSEQKIPVHLRGVLTFFDDHLFSRFIQDDTAGIYLQFPTNFVPPPLQAGQVVEVNGVSAPGEYAPVVMVSQIQMDGQGVLPAPKPTTYAQLASGAEDSQFVEITGVVRSVWPLEQTPYYHIEITTGGGRLSVYVKNLPVANSFDLVDSKLRVLGVCSTQFNRLGQLFAIRLMVPRPDDLKIEVPAPANPFAAPARPIGSLLQFAPPQESYGHRVKLAGTVAYFEPGSAVFIEDGKLGLQCQTALRDMLKPGDRVEVLGTPAKGEYSPILEDSIYRKVGDGTEPQADAVDLNEVLTGKHDCRLVQMSAKVLERVDRGIHQFLLLEADGFVFEGYLPRTADGDPLTDLANGSEVSVTGICLIERGNNWQAGKDWRAESFSLLLRSTADVIVLQAAAAVQDSPQTTLWVVGTIEAAVLVAILLFWRKKSRA